MMVAAISSTNPKTENPSTTTTTRPPLLPSEKDNGVAAPKRPKSRQVSSRYLSPSPSPSPSTSNSSLPTPTPSISSRRFPSPLASRNSTPASSSLPKRSVSVDRRRPGRPDLNLKTNNASDVSAATKLLVTSTRSLSVSFQGEAFSLPISKTKVTPVSPNLSTVRKGTPERRRASTPVRAKIDNGGDHVENTKPPDQHRWPGRTRQQASSPLLSRSLDCTGEKNKLTGSGNVIRALQQSLNLDRRASIDGRLSLDLGNAECLKPVRQNSEGNLGNESCVQSDLTASDSDSVSSGSTGVQECGGLSRVPNGSRGINVSAKFWQETNSRMRRLQDPGSPMATSPGSKLIVPPKFMQSKRLSTDSPLSSPRTMSSPSRVRPASPSKFMTSQMLSSPARGMISPSRGRNSVSGTISSNFSEAPSVLSFAVDVRRGKVGENRIVDAHLLRLLYNRQLQWRYVNARTEAALFVQKHNAEKNLWNAWITISDLRDTVTKKRHRLQLMRQKLKLASILKGQVTCLEDWASFDKDHSISLLGAIEALKASTLRLPVGGGAIADIQSLKDAVSSALDVMQAMASSICSLLAQYKELLVLKMPIVPTLRGLFLDTYLPCASLVLGLCCQVEEVNSLLMELAKVTAKERALLGHCTDFLSMVAASQVKDCSLRTHMLQHKRVPST